MRRLDDKRPSVLAVIVTYNSASVLRDCLASLATTAAALRVAIIDNASADGSADIAERTFPGALVVRNDRNVGFAVAVNQAARALGGDADYILLVNPDTVLAPDSIDALLALAASDPGAGIYGGRMLERDGRLNPTSCLAAPSLFHAAAFGLGLSLFFRGLPGVDPDSLGGWKREGLREVPVLTGALLLVDGALWRELDGMDARFFLYGEDADFCLRARALGARPMFTDKCVYRHIGGASSGSREAFTKALLRGKATLYRRHLAGGRGRVATGLLVVGTAIRAALERFVRPDEHAWRSAWRDRLEWVDGW